MVGVDEVFVEDDGIHIIAASGHLELDHRQARPLAWVVPGATRWRVRKVPEVLVWAKTFNRLAPPRVAHGFPIAATAPLRQPG